MCKGCASVMCLYFEIWYKFGKKNFRFLGPHPTPAPMRVFSVDELTFGPLLYAKYHRIQRVSPGGEKLLYALRAMLAVKIQDSGQLMRFRVILNHQMSRIFLIFKMAAVSCLDFLKLKVLTAMQLG